jgi:hypothetical protein
MKHILSFEEFLNESSLNEAASPKISNFLKTSLVGASVSIRDYNVSPKTTCILLEFDDKTAGEWKSFQMGRKKPSILKDLIGLLDSYNMSFSNQLPTYGVDTWDGYRLSLFSKTNNTSDLLKFVDDVISPINSKIASDIKKSI